MKTTLRIAILASLAVAGHAARADVYLIANPSLQLTADEAKEVFIGEKQLAGSVKLVPIDNAAAQAEFLSKVHGMDAARYNTLWAKKGFRDGLNPPAVKGSDAEVLAVVRATPGALGYVTAPPTGVNVIRKY
jgi:hypothetical protein